MNLKEIYNLLRLYKKYNTEENQVLKRGLL